MSRDPLEEWPSFLRIPLDQALPEARPQGQTLAKHIWWDGEIKHAEDQSIHYSATALHYGTSVFEGIRCYPTPGGPALLRVRDHIVRMTRSAKLYGMALPFNIDELVQGTLEVARRNKAINAYIRPLAYFGEGPIDLKPKKQCRVGVFIATRELGSFLGENALRNGVRATISSWRKFHHTSMPTMAKASGQYANSVLASHEALDRGFDEAILLNQDGTVSSAAGENIFFVRDGVLYTNDESSSIVPGITRDCVIQIARNLDVEVVVKPFTREQMMRSDEVFLTGTAAEVTPVREIDGTELLTGRDTLGAVLQRGYLAAATAKDPNYGSWLTLV